LTPLFPNMPQPTLAAIVIAAMLHLTSRVTYAIYSSAALVILMLWSSLCRADICVMHGIALGVVFYPCSY